MNVVIIECTTLSRSECKITKKIPLLPNLSLVFCRIILISNTERSY